MEVLSLKQTLILPFLCRKSATMCQIDSSKVSNSKLKLDLCNCVRTEIPESTAPSQQQHRQGTIILGHLVDNKNAPFLGAINC